METSKIPNFNTLSTLIDRLSIENVKLAHFENAIEHDNLPKEKVTELERKVQVQKSVLSALKTELTKFMEKAFLSGKYEYLKEERTFK